VVTDVTAVDPVRLTEWTTCGGCAAKWGAAPLNALVRDLAATADPALLVGLSTTDFFPPLVDDPSDFGAIAAANACSDVFAMGGRVILALNVAAFPERLPVETIGAIFSAAAAVVAEAGGAVAGGHTIRSEEPIFGLAVQGLVHPDRIWTKSGAMAGDALMLSKPIGSGIVLAGGTAAERAEAIVVMRTLNRRAAESLSGLPGAGPHAVTDVTGFGLLGHGWEMAERSGVRLRLAADTLPLYGGALAAAEAGTRTGGDARNRTHLQGHVVVGAGVGAALEALCYDPQTSGGLLAAVGPEHASALSAAGFHRIGDVAEGPAAVDLFCTT
jgi:selenide,water dikinase